ncbi:MAG: lytic transglycosylase domain-containing protein [Methylococcales bacterium]|jgi:hypothetical protein|nr:lytic transglycosylase domain-containing protein [Methylococcales bacterium]
MFRLILLLSFLLSSSNILAGSAFSEHSIWKKEADRIHVDPYVLYAIALTESRRQWKTDKGVRPWPFTLNNRTLKRKVYPDLDSCLIAVKKLIKEKQYNVDIGVMQINWKWHAHRVSSVEELLNPDHNVKVAADILSDELKVAKGDIVEAIALYHSKNSKRGKDYSRKVISIAVKMRQLYEQSLVAKK